jgi:DNA repair protein RecO (recombination protein O)
MSTEKSHALIIRLADFSESSRVVTFYTRDFGKISALAKGAKRLKGPFEGAIDLLSEVRLVFIRKESAGLDLATETQLVRRFHPHGRNMASLYAGYYVAELLDGLTLEHDPHPPLYDAAITALERISLEEDHRLPVLQFELLLLREIGNLPTFDACEICGRPVESGETARYWVSQGGLICGECGRPEFEHTTIHPTTIAFLRRMLGGEDGPDPIPLTPQASKELRRMLTAAVSHVLERRPKMLAYLKF